MASAAWNMDGPSSAGQMSISAFDSPPQFSALTTLLLSTALMLLTLKHFAHGFSWALCAYPAAGLVDSFGHIALAFHDQYPTAHAAYLVGFAARTLAPSILAVALFVSFSSFLQPTRLLPTLCRAAAFTFITAQVASIALQVVAVLKYAEFLSSAPITSPAAALARLDAQRIGTQLATASYLLQACCISAGLLFAGFVFAFARIEAADSPRWLRQSRTALVVLTVSSVLLVVQTFGKHSTAVVALDEHAMPLAQGLLYILSDCLPMTAAYAMTCLAHNQLFGLVQSRVTIIVALDPEEDASHLVYTDSFSEKIMDW